MGRYDSRLKVYDGSVWKNVKQLRVYNGSSWIDFGNNESTLKRSLYVKDANLVDKRITRDHSVYNIPGEIYGTGKFNILPKGNFQFYNYTSGPKGVDFNFQGTFRKTASGDITIFKSWTKSSAGGIEIILTNAGKVRVKTKYDSWEASPESSNSFALNQWFELRVWASVSKANNRISIKLNNVTTADKLAYCTVINPNSFSDTEVMNTGVQFKNTLTISGSNYATSATSQTTRQISPTGSGGKSGQWTSFTKVDTSSTGVQWI